MQYTPEANERGLSLPALHCFELFQKLSFKIDHEVQHLLKSLEKNAFVLFCEHFPTESIKYAHDYG